MNTSESRVDVTPPLLYRLVVNPFRRWLERDDRLLVEQWKAAYGPAPLKVVPFLNLRVIRSASRKVA